MATAWYNSQIVGVVVGGGLGFLSGYVLNKIEKRRNHRAFRMILKKEIELLTLRLTSHRNNCVDCWNAISERRLASQNLMNWLHKSQIYSTEYPTGIFKGNLDKLTPFPEKVVQNLIAFYALVEECKHNMAVLERENPPGDYIAPSRILAGDPKYPESFKKVNMLLRAAVQSGEDLKKELDKEINEDWQLKSILKLFKTKVLDTFVRR